MPKTNKLEWKKARQFWKDVFPYIIEYNPIGPKPEQVKQIYKLNKIKENLEACLKHIPPKVPTQIPSKKYS